MRARAIANEAVIIYADKKTRDETKNVNIGVVHEMSNICIDSLCVCVVLRITHRNKAV